MASRARLPCRKATLSMPVSDKVVGGPSAAIVPNVVCFVPCTQSAPDSSRVVICAQGKYVQAVEPRGAWHGFNTCKASNFGTVLAAARAH